MAVQKNIAQIARHSRSVFLLSLDWGRPKDPPMSLGHSSILTHLTKRGVPAISSTWSTNSPGFSITPILDDIFEASSLNDSMDIGVGMFVWNDAPMKQIMRELKNSDVFSGRIILGGSQISYTKSDVEQFYPHADVFVRGYAEEALARLMLSGEAKPVVAGVHYAGEPDLGMSASADLRQLPSPYLNGTIKPQPFLRWETQRGCPFSCGFCQHRESDVSKTRRPFDSSRINDEISFFAENPIIQDIAVLDPVFNSGPSYMDVMRKFVNVGYTGKLSLQCRMEMVNDEFLDVVEALNKTGNVVLEFGLQTIHRNEEVHIQRPNNKKRIKRVLSETYRRKIACEISLIFALPEQTVESFQDSIDFCKSYQVSVILAYPLRLHRGTPLHANKSKLGLVESTDEDAEIMNLGEDHIGHVVASPSFTRDDWIKMAKIAEGLDEYNAHQVQSIQKNAVGKMSKTLHNTLLKSSNMH